MLTFRTNLRLLLFTAAIPCQLTSAGAVTVDGRWNANLHVSDKLTIPFRLDFVTHGPSATGYFFDGERPVPSTSGSFNEGSLHLHFDIYNADLDLSLHGDSLEGKYILRRPKKDIPRVVTATRYTAAAASSANIPLIEGAWELRGTEDNREVAWKFVLKQQRKHLEGAILRLDGDTGALTGSIEGAKFTLSHFSGARPALLEGSLQPDGTLALLLDRETKLTGVLWSDARSKILDPFHATTVSDPAAPFQLTAPDVTGKPVSLDGDPFRGKVVLASIGGTWCPNCMDEAPFLVDLYRRYHAHGLEIVGLNFESGDEAYDRTRIRSFIERYQIPYTVLLVGTTDQVNARLPQLVNFGAFPTTIFIGRDGRVKGIHDGFASIATGTEHQKLKQETDELVERLLAAPATSSNQP